ncbi:hypothetical protein [Kitasatospora sp. NPDC096204]|uniref:hypothetical protein n=1 Tax=Kitasatospora sp. NPDC096204 TaxID=3364094 RepID=UPI00382EF74E
MDLYSGRPNPRFTLDGPAADELAHRIGELTPQPATTAGAAGSGGEAGGSGDEAGGGGAPYGGLGYRGLRVLAGPHAAAPGIAVGGGVVTLPTPHGPPRRLRDPGRALERWLLDQGAGVLDPAVLATARRELAR